MIEDIYHKCMEIHKYVLLSGLTDVREGGKICHRNHKSTIGYLHVQIKYGQTVLFAFQKFCHIYSMSGYILILRQNLQVNYHNISSHQKFYFQIFVLTGKYFQNQMLILGRIQSV